MATGRIGVSLSELQRIAAQLDETAAWLSSGTVLAGAPGAEPYDEVISAIGEFDEDWERAMTHLRDATADLGAKVAATGQLVAEHDTAAAESVRKLTGLLHSLRLDPVEA